MRRVVLLREDFAMFHQDITPHDYEFFRTHSGAFKRMWQEQTRRFWSVFLSTFDHFIWNYGAMKDFPIKIDDLKTHIDELVFSIQHQFVEGTAATAKALISDCVTVAQNRHYISMLDKASYAQNPFYMKETRETFRKLFGQPNAKNTFVKVLCGLPVYLKFAGAVVEVLKRWLHSDELLVDEEARESYFAQIHRNRCEDAESIQSIHRVMQRELKKESLGEVEKKVTKKDFAREATRQKALEWIDESSAAVDEFSDLSDEDTEEKIGYKSSCKQAIRSATVDVHESLIKSLADAKMREIEEARARGEDIQPILDGLGISLNKKKRRRNRRKKKNKRATGEEEEDKENEVVEVEVVKPTAAEPPSNHAMSNEDQNTTQTVEKTEAVVKRSQEHVTDTVSNDPPQSKPSEATTTKMADRPPTVTAVMNNSVSIASLASNMLSMNTNKTNEKMVERFASAIKTATQSLPSSVANMNLTGDGDSTLVVMLGNSKLVNDEEYAAMIKRGCSAVVSSTTVRCEELQEILATTKSYEELAEAVEKKKGMSIVVNVPLTEETVGTAAKKAEEPVIEDIETEKDEAMETEEPRESQELQELQEDEAGVARKLHVCGYCGVEEKRVKSFKRCQKCRGKPRPKYYCSRVCQASDWKSGHKLIHKQD